MASSPEKKPLKISQLIPSPGVGHKQLLFSHTPKRNGEHRAPPPVSSVFFCLLACVDINSSNFLPVFLYDIVEASVILTLSYDKESFL